MTALTRMLLLSAAAVLATGCLPGSAATALDGREFLSVALTQDGAEQPLVDGTRIRLRFVDGNISVQAGCNTMGAGYEVRDGRLFADGGAMTEMGCDAPRHAQDDRLFAFIGSRPAIQLDAERLVLTDGTTAIAFVDREVAEPDSALIGTSWKVDAIVSGDAVASVPGEVHSTLMFTADGRVGIWTGCNEGGAAYAIEGDRIGFTEVVTTDRACQGPGAELEAAVLRVLSADGLTYGTVANRLDIAGPGIGLGLVAVPGID